MDCGLWTLSKIPCRLVPLLDPALKTQNSGAAEAGRAGDAVRTPNTQAPTFSFFFGLLFKNLQHQTPECSRFTPLLTDWASAFSPSSHRPSGNCGVAEMPLGLMTPDKHLPRSSDLSSPSPTRDVARWLHRGSWPRQTLPNSVFNLLAVYFQPAPSESPFAALDSQLHQHNVVKMSHVCAVPYLWHRSTLYAMYRSMYMKAPYHNPQIKSPPALGSFAIIQPHPLFLPLESRFWSGAESSRIPPDIELQFAPTHLLEWHCSSFDNRY